MKRSCIVKSLVALIMLPLVSCDRNYKEEIYQDSYTIDTEEAVYSIVQNDLITPSFRLLELAEVYTGYQMIRSDREKALEYVAEYLGGQSRVYYEYMYIDRWGKISLNLDGSFTAYPNNWKSCWIACNMDRTVMIESPQEHVYSASGISEDAIYNFNGSINDDTVRITNLHASYATDKFGNPIHSVELDVIEPMTAPMCKEGMAKLEPVSGKVQIKYRSKYANRTFQVEFHETYKTIILPDGTTRNAEPEEAHGWNEY